MKVIATNIFDFTSFYKFGFKTVTMASVIDLSEPTLTGKELLSKTGFFEEEYEVFYLEVNDNFLSTNGDLVNLSLFDVDFIIPISDTGARLLQSKIPDFKLSEPIDVTLFQKLITARNDFLALQGAKNILSSFAITWKPEYDKLQGDFLQSLNKYKADLNAEQETILDQVLFYERSKPYPLNDMGFLFDVGSIGRTWFKLSDEDFKQRNELKDGDSPKYELVEQMIALSKFLQNQETKGIWSKFIKYYEDNNYLQKLNNELSLSAGLQINNLLIIAFYLKFRDLIRNTRMLEDKTFTDEINRHLLNVPEETKVALLLNGLFFGALKFKELHYKYNPLNIARYKFVKPSVLVPKAPETSVDILEPNPVIIPTPDVKTTEDEIEIDSPSTKDKNRNESKKSFDQTLWLLLQPALKKYTKPQVTKIKRSFDKVEKLNGEMFKEKSFIDDLYEGVKKSTFLTKERSKITAEMVSEIELTLREIVGS